MVSAVSEQYRPMQKTTSLKVNLACGPVFIIGDDWLNLDFAAHSPDVLRANLLTSMPITSDSVQLVYSSHFIEHIPKPDVDGFLRECLRILQPGGVLRLVLPDLQEMARTYLHLRQSGNHERADFLVVEMIDQCVRRESGGELGRIYQRLRGETTGLHTDLMLFIRERNGEDLSENGIRNGCPGRRYGHRPSLPGRIAHAVRNRLQRAWLRLLLAGLPSAFRAQNVSLAGVGERHHWLWDFHQLKQALETAGFIATERCSADSSAIADFPFYPLDLDVEGRPRKGAESMYVEARKPA